MRRLLRWGLYALALMLIVAIGAVAFIQTGPGKRLLAAKLSSRLSTPNSAIEISGIDGWIPLDLSINALRLSDRDGVWLEAKGITLDWSPRALIGGRIHIDEIGAKRIEIARSPLSDETPEPPSDAPFRLPEIPKSSPPVTVKRLAVSDILLGAPLLGEAARFALQGSIRANDDGDEVTANLDLGRTDGATAFAKLEAIAGLDPRTLDLTLNAGENDGMLAALAGRPEIGEVDLSLEGGGPLEDWSGRLRANAEGLALLEADLGLALVEQPRLAISGTAEPAPGTLADDIAALVGDRLSIELDLVQTAAQALDLKKAVVTTALATLDGVGSVSFDQGDLTLRTGLAVADIAPLGPFAQAALSGKAEAQLMVDGTLTAPDGELALRAGDLAFDDKTAEAITTDIRWTATAPLSADRPAFDIAIEGQASGLTIPGTVLPDSDARWTGRLSAPFEGEVVIDQITIESAGSSLTASGAIDPAKLDGRIDLALDAPSMERLAAPYGQAVGGKAAIKAMIRLSDQAKDIAVDLDASLSDLSGLPPGAGELLGDQVRLQAKVGLDPSRTLRLETLTAEGAAVALDGEASLDLDQNDMTGRLSATLPDLTALGTLIPEGTEGAIALEADLGGSLDTPEADLRVTGQDLILAHEPITALDIALSGKDLIAAPNGDLAIEVNARETPATLALAYRLAEGTLHLDAIDLKAPETEAGGALKLALETSLIDGALQGRIAELDALEPLIRQPLGGSVDFTASFAPAGDLQNAGLALKGRGIGGAFGSLKTVDIDASITDIKAQPQIDAKASLTGFQQGASTIDALTLTTRGSGDQLGFTLDVAGEVLKPLELATEGTVAFEEGVKLGLESLNGEFAGEPLRLARPLTLQQAESGMQVKDLDLQLGEARLKGDVDVGEETVSGAIDLRDLPLRWSEVFGGPLLNGAAHADIDLSGSAASPKVVAALEVDGLLADNLSPEDLPLDITLNALLDRGRLAANLKGTGLTRKPITATASLPAKLQLRPFAFDMPKDGELDGKIDAKLLLARLADLLALDDQSMEGVLIADIAIGGTLAEPKIAGPVVLENAEYENGTTAARIHSLNMQAIASNERIDIKSFTGRTGDTGKLDAEGWLELDADADFPLSFTLRLDKAELVDRDDLDGRISGEIAMIGSLADPEINGDLMIDRAELSIPEGGGPNLPEIDVEEVGGHIVNPPKDETIVDDQEKPFDPALDIRISLPNKVYVRGRGLESEWQGDLHITGRAGDPIIVGTLEVKKGQFDFLDKRFALELGEITFSGQTPPNPIIALEAVSEDDDFTAIIKVSGPADDPKLLLSSDPVLPEDEILARLLFNRELSQIGAVEAGKLAFALNRLRGGGGFDAFGEIRDILKIDTLDVVSDEEGDSKVKAGKYLNDDVYVEVEQGAGDESSRARVEIELLPNISLEADTGGDANSGVGLKWKFNY